MTFWNNGATLMTLKKTDVLFKIGSSMYSGYINHPIFLVWEVLCIFQNCRLNVLVWSMHNLILKETESWVLNYIFISSAFWCVVSVFIKFIKVNIGVLKWIVLFLWITKLTLISVKRLYLVWKSCGQIQTFRDYSAVIHPNPPPQAIL